MFDKSELTPKTKIAESELLASVIICTRNRSASLERALNSIVEASRCLAEMDGAEWELLVVDNGSTDNTQDVVKQFSDRLPIRAVFQPIAGLSNARNAGLEAAFGKFVLWTDDDVLVEAGWLRSYFRAFRQHPETELFGGRAVPKFEGPEVSWFVANQQYLSSLLAIRDNRDWTDIKPGRLPFGLNFAVRRDVQLRHKFDPELGVAPGRRIGGEESSMLRSALNDGATGRWVWDATVFHLIPASRQSASYVLEYYRAQGYLYPKRDVENGSGNRLWGAGHKLRLKVWLMFISSGFARLIQRRGWVGKYADYARWAGTLDRLRADSDERKESL